MGPFVALAGAERAEHLPDLVGAALLSVVVAGVLARVVQRSDDASRAAHALLGAVTALHEVRTEDAAADVLAEVAEQLLTPSATLVMLTTSPGSALYTNRAQRGVDGELDERAIDAPGVSGMGLAMSEGRALFVPHASGSPLGATGQRPTSASRPSCSSPSRGSRATSAASSSAGAPRRRSSTPSASRSWQSCRTQAGSVLERLRSVGRLQVQATTDPLTGLANRRVFLDALERLRPGGAVVFVDLDHFKRLNDTLGHAAGDEVLRAFGAALRSSVRDGDCAARYGGEEFALVLPSAASVDMTEAARVVVERLGSRWEGPVTFSVGIATHRAGDTPAATLARADGAVYEAKARGRNTVVVAESLELAV